MALTCGNCRSPLTPGAKFCSECGTRLDAPAAPTRELRSYTPKHLADRVLGARSALEGERKQVTVLFADVKGSMDLARATDPEEWHEILDGFFRILAEGVHRFEGTVNQFTGDGIMALFGAPIAHEDHAQRACYAALHLDGELRRYADEIRRTRGLSFAVRMGINSGEVVVGKIGDDLRMDYTAQGLVVGLAARMEQLAEPGRVYLTRATAALVDGFFRLRDLGAFAIKGIDQPVTVFELQGVGALRTRLDLSRARGFSRFVGRAAEMATLEQALGRALAGEGGVVGIVGDPGLGKSRLCFELAERCRTRGIAVVQAQAVAHGKAIPFSPMLGLLRGYFGVTEHDDPRSARDKVAGRIVLLDPALTDSLPLVFDFLGVPDAERPSPVMEADARRRRLFAVIDKVLRAQREPHVFLIEDLQWLDGASRALLEHLVLAAPESRSLFLLNYRPELEPRWRGRPGVEEIALEPLGDEALDALCADLLGRDQSLAGFAALLRERTVGNPFFIEEVVHELADAGALAGERGAYRLTQALPEVAIPSSVQAVIAARIDRLDEAAKDVLQTAAVIGQELGATLLARVVGLAPDDLGEALRTLLRTELLFEVALYPEAVYGFKHPLTQEVAYRSPLAERRRKTHAAVARAIAELDAARLDERAALLTHHWEEAGERVEAARWSRRAALWAGSHDVSEAMAHWRRVCTLLGDAPEGSPSPALEARAAVLGLGWLVGIHADEAEAIFAEGLALAARSRDPRWRVRLTAHYAGIKAGQGAVDDYLRLIREAVALADEGDDAGLRAAVRTPLVRAHLVAGRIREALEICEQALRDMPADPAFGNLLGYSPYLNLSLLRADLLGYVGRWSDAALAFESCMRVCREHGHFIMLAHASIDYAWWKALFGGDDALAEARLAFDMAEKLGSRMTQLFAHNALGFAELQSGHAAEALAVLEQAREVAAEMHNVPETQVDTLALFARAALAAGEHERAREAAEQAVAAARRWHTLAWECIAQLAYAEVRIAIDGAGAGGDVTAALDRAAALVEETGALCFEPLIVVHRAALERARDA